MNAPSGTHFIAEPINEKQKEGEKKLTRRFGFVTPNRIISGRFVSSTDDTALRGLIDNPWMSHQCEDGEGLQKRKLVDMSLKTAFVYNIFDGLMEYRDTTSVNKLNVVFAYVVEPNSYEQNPEKVADSKTQRGALTGGKQQYSRVDVGLYSLEGESMGNFKYLLDSKEMFNSDGHTRKFDPNFISLSDAKIVRGPQSHLEILLKATKREINSFRLGNANFPVRYASGDDKKKVLEVVKKFPNSSDLNPLQRVFGMNDNFIIFNRNYREGSY